MKTSLWVVLVPRNLDVLKQEITRVKGTSISRIRKLANPLVYYLRTEPSRIKFIIES